MSTIITVKKAIIDLLKADTTLQGLLTKDSNGNWPVYHSLVQHKIHKPCITIEDITGTGEISALDDSYDGSKRYEWNSAVIQIDSWSSKHADERDQIAVAVQKCLLKNRSAQSFFVQEHSVAVLDEPNVKPPLWRKSLRYRVFDTQEVSTS